MTATGFISPSVGAPRDSGAQREGRSGPGFAAMLDSAQGSRLQQAPAPPRSDARTDDAALCFLETSVFGARAPALGDTAPHERATLGDLLVTGALQEPRAPAGLMPEVTTPSPAAPRAPQQATRLRFHDSAHPVHARMRHAPVVKTEVGAIRTAALPLQEASIESVDATQRAAALRHLVANRHVSAFVVALRASEGEPAVYARIGKMASAERTRLRSAVRALLSAYGLVDASITIDEGVRANHD